MLGKMKKNFLLAPILAFCVLLPVHAVENEKTSVKIPNAAESSFTSTVSDCDAVSGNNLMSRDETGDLSVFRENEPSDSYTARLSDLTKENEYCVYRNQLKAKLCRQQQMYLSAVLSEKKESYEIAQTRFALGYLTEAEVKNAEIQVTSAKLQKESVDAQLQFLQECILLRGGDYTKELPEGELPRLTADYITRFLEQSSQIQSYNQQITQYENSLKDAGSGEIAKLLEQKISILKLNSQQYKLELQEYVLQLQLQYGTLLREIQKCDNEISVIERKLQNQTLLYENGKAAKNTVTVLHTQLQQLMVSRMSNICDARLILYVLEHTLENKTV